METEEFWRDSFGDEYTERNRVNWLDRVPFWTSIISKTGLRTVLEFGCNVGWNLLAIRTVKPEAWTHGLEINDSARLQAEFLGFDVTISTPPSYLVDLTFTAGVLIHVATEDLEGVMRDMVDRSNQYILAVEYESEEEEEIEYRGNSGKLWKRPYGRMYQEMGLKLIETGKAEGFDDCTYWLFRK